MPVVSSLAASTNRVARLERCSAPALMVSTQRRSRSPSSEVARRSLMARMPVSGVRTSWAKTASAASTTPAAGIRAPFPRGSLARGLLARVLVVTCWVRFFSGLVLAEFVLTEFVLPEVVLAELVFTALVLIGFVFFPVLDDAPDSNLPDLATGATRPVLRFRTRFIMAPLT